jgi:hypothetical protein
MDCPTRRVAPFDWEFFFSSLQYGKENSTTVNYSSQRRFSSLSNHTDNRSYQKEERE